MIWLAWRQFRTQAAVMFGALVIAAVVVISTGLHLRHEHLRYISPSYNAFRQLLGTLVLILPATTGAFWGAPLVAREFETGTHRLAWTQSITRTRWLATKVAVVGSACVVASGLLSWMVTWWYAPTIDDSTDKFNTVTFSENGIVPIGYALFAFALGTLAGVVIRKTLPAMATTLVVYFAAWIVVAEWVRPHFATPLRQLVSSSGSVETFGAYQPNSRYWPFQWAETGLYVGLAVILIGLCFWWINDHRARAVHAAPTRAEVSRSETVATVR